MDKIDVHVHVFDLPSERFPRELSGLAPADRACPIEALIADMDASGIDRAVLIEMNGTQSSSTPMSRIACRRGPTALRRRA